MSISVISYLDTSAADLIAEKAAENARLAEEAKLASETANFETVLTEQLNTQSQNAAVVPSYTSEELESFFDEASNTYHVSKDLLKSIAKAESNFNASAVSHAGAVGIMQLMPETAASLGVSNSYDARENILGGANYISSLLNRYNGDTSLALAAYNAGSGNVDKYGGIPPFEETQNYVRKVLGYLGENTATEEAPKTLFDLSGSEREAANQMLETFFASNNVSKESLDLIVALLKQAQIDTTTT